LNEGNGIGIQFSTAVMGSNQFISSNGVLGAGHTYGSAGIYDRYFITVHVLAQASTSTK
jgi:hypothetical protein